MFSTLESLFDLRQCRQHLAKERPTYLQVSASYAVFTLIKAHHQLFFIVICALNSFRFCSVRTNLQNLPEKTIIALLSKMVLFRTQGSHFFGLTKFHDISMIFPGFLVNFQVLFSLFLKYDFQVVLNINICKLLEFHLNKKLIISIILQISKPSFLLQ